MCATRVPEILKCFMGKKKKTTGSQTTGRTRINPRTGETETVSGTKAGKGRAYLPMGHPLRTHDANGIANKKNK